MQKDDDEKWQQEYVNVYQENVDNNITRYAVFVVWLHTPSFWSF